MTKFETVCEGVIERYRGGGLLTGDRVKIKKDALKDEWCKDQASNTVDQLRAFMETPHNLIVSAVKALRPSIQGTQQADLQVDDFYADIVMELAPGRFYSYMTIPVRMLDLQDDGINLRPVPDEFVYDNKDEEQKPHEPKVDHVETPLNPVHGTKTHEGDKNLLNKNQKLQYATAAKPSTKMYLSGLKDR